MKRIIGLKRKKERKTDYAARMNLLKSKFPRLVLRKTNRYILVQIVESREAQDKTICSMHSKELSNFGWKFSFKNIPAAYATGFLLGKKALIKGVTKVIVDIGRQTSSKGSKLYGALNGAVDSGLKINCDEKIMPSAERIFGQHTKNYEKIKKIITQIKK